MYNLPEQLRDLVPYEPVSGEYTVRLDANESFLSLPQELRREVGQAVSQIDFNRYPDPYATELCRKFAGFYGVQAQNVVAGNGSDELIGVIVSGFAAPGESITAVSPDFSMYGFYAQLYHVKVHNFIKENGLSFSAADLIRAVRENGSKILFFSNPCNPTSTVAGREEILSIIDALPDCLVVVDEAYMEFSDQSVLDQAERRDHVILLKTFSKAFGMAAIRLGFAVACPAIARALKAAKSPYNVNTMTQVVGCVLLDHPEYIRDCIRRIIAARDDLYAKLSALAAQKPQLGEVTATCANFVYLRTSRAAALAEGLAKAGIAVRDFADSLRISAGSRQENEAVLDTLSALL